MTDIFLDELLISNSFSLYLDEQSFAESFSIFVEDQTDITGESELKDYIPATLAKVYIDEPAIETTQLGIFRDSIKATSGGVAIKGYYYNYYGAFQIAGNVPNLLLDLSNPISHYLRTF